MLQSTSTSPRWLPSHPQPLVLQPGREEWSDGRGRQLVDSSTQTEDAHGQRNVDTQTDEAEADTLSSAVRRKKNQAKKSHTRKKKAHTETVSEVTENPNCLIFLTSCVIFFFFSLANCYVIFKQWNFIPERKRYRTICHDPRRVQRSEKRTKSCKYDIFLFSYICFLLFFFSLFHRIHFIVFSVDRAKLQENCYRVNVFPLTSINELCISCVLI